MSLTELQIIEIENRLQQNGLEYVPLQDELLDHCCCQWIGSFLFVDNYRNVRSAHTLGNSVG